MKQNTRIYIGLIVLVVLLGVVLVTDTLQRRQTAASQANTTLAPGSIPIYLDGKMVGGFSPADLEKLQKVSFVDPAEGKTQEGWLLRDVILLYVPGDRLQPASQITVSSSSRGKSAQLSWAEVDAASNMMMFDLTNRGTLKLVSKLPKLSTRDEWIQDADKIEITSP